MRRSSSLPEWHDRSNTGLIRCPAPLPAGCRRWNSFWCGLELCVTCFFPKACQMRIPIEVLNFDYMISSSAITYRPEVSSNTNVPIY